MPEGVIPSNKALRDRLQCRVHECLYDASGNVLAVVEAKRCSRHAREADEQLRHYVTEISKKQPFAPFRIHGQRP